jgi:AcrR family transcriptional regulator
VFMGSYFVAKVMKVRPVASHGKTGRPLSFERDAVLHKAMLTFWQYGYETTSISDLTKAMGVSAPSLYAAFGDKKQLFLEAMRLYAGDPEAIGRAIDEGATAYDVAREMLFAAATKYTGDATPKGCLLASATASGSSASADVQHAVAQIRRDIRKRFSKRIKRDIANGVLPPETDSSSLSGLVMAVMEGMSVLARDGASRNDLLAIAEATLQAWAPKGVSRKLGK